MPAIVAQSGPAAASAEPTSCLEEITRVIRAGKPPNSERKAPRIKSTNEAKSSMGQSFPRRSVTRSSISSARAVRKRILAPVAGLGAGLDFGVVRLEFFEPFLEDAAETLSRGEDNLVILALLRRVDALGKIGLGDSAGFASVGERDSRVTPQRNRFLFPAKPVT